jgi:hypothetical protein
MQMPVTNLWQRDNNMRQSAAAKQPDRLTLPVNWAQIGPGRGDLAFFSSRRFLWD